jgi:hypothetical protein
MRSMVEGQVRLVRILDLLESGAGPSTSCAAPPPPVGEEC